MDFGNLGIALGAYTDEAKAQADEGRKQRQFAQQEKEWQRQDEVDKQLKEAHDFYNQGVQAINEGKIGDFAPRAVDYLNSTNYMGKSRGAYMLGGDGKHYVAYSDGNKSGPPQMLELTPQMAHNALKDMYMHRLAAADTRAAFANLNALEQLGLNREKVGVDRFKAQSDDTFHNVTFPAVHRETNASHEKIAAGNNAAALEGHRISAAPAWANFNLNRGMVENNRVVSAKYAPLFEQAQFAIDNAKTEAEQKAAILNANALQMRYRNELESKNPSGNGLQLRMPGDGRSSGPQQMTVTDYAKLEELAGERAMALSKDPKYKNQTPEFLKSQARSQILGEMGYGTNVKGVVGVGNASPGYVNPYAANAPTDAARVQQILQYPEESQDLDQLIRLNHGEYPAPAKNRGLAINPKTGKPYGISGLGYRGPDAPNS